MDNEMTYEEMNQYDDLIVDALVQNNNATPDEDVLEEGEHGRPAPPVMSVVPDNGIYESKSQT